MNFVLCHGWSLDQRSMLALAAALQIHYPQASLQLIELGMTGMPINEQILIEPNVPMIAIGHSYGFAWLLKQSVNWQALVAINGFTHFCRGPHHPTGTPKRLLEAMLARLGNEAEALLAEFYQRCGLPEGALFKTPARLDTARLSHFLSKLRDTHLSLPDLPVLAIAGKQDTIVAADLSQDCFKELAWLDGQHALPQQHPAACARLIAKFIEQSANLRNPEKLD
ncbi:alpha/beta fold hydrolase [Ampullimonas aquatilis]|uniref:alpha/beta fold hydrolase n=1 Tax=Ampullimonas aquatilis TaxID=1341549 RepID=UPI003C727BFE